MRKISWRQGASPSMAPRNWAIGVALGISIAMIALSIFLAVVGSQVSMISVTRQCPGGGACIDTQESRTYFSPEPVATIPLLIAAIVARGLLTRWMILAWSGASLLLAFSFLSIFSIGLFYAPLSVALLGLLFFIRTHAHSQASHRSGETPRVW
jgi:hypothetical protein